MRGINLKPWEVRAILAGARVIVRIIPKDTEWTTTENGRTWPAVNVRGICQCKPSPFGLPGTPWFGRETWVSVPATAYRQSYGVQQIVNPHDQDMCAIYKVGWDRCRPCMWRSPAIMPAWASRIRRVTTFVHVCRVQEFTEDEARRMWVPDSVLTRHYGEYRDAYHEQFDADNGRGAWDANLLVWVCEHRKVEE